MPNNSLNILIVTSSYPPEIRSSSHLMQELAEELAERGYSVFVATTYPTMNLPDSFHDTGIQEYSVENNVKVIRIRTPLHPHQKGNFIQRGISQLILPYIFFRGIKKNIREQIDTVIVYSPPLTLAIAGRKVAHKFNARFILNVQDIFPQNAIDLGIIKNPILIKLFEVIEKSAYTDADVITVHSKGNRDVLTKRKHVSSEKVTVLHNWIDIKEYEKTSENNYFRKKLNLEGKFIFFFGGVMGPSQGLDLLLKAAKRIEEHENIVFLFAGDGLEKERLKKLADKLSLKNVIFHPFVSKDEYQLLLKEIDVGLVCLSAKNKTPVVPGKILGYMAACVPVVALLNQESDGHQIISDAGCGFSDVSNDVAKAGNLLLKIYGDKEDLNQYGTNGYNYVLKNFLKKVCVDKIVDLIH